MNDSDRPSEELLKLPLEVRAEMAMKSAVKKVIERAIQNGRSIHAWQDQKVVEITADELKRETADNK